MPVYEYQCKACGREFEYQQRMSDPDKTDCEACGQASLERLISRTAFALKGGGWYKDLYASTKPESKSTDTASSGSTAASSDGGASSAGAASSSTGSSSGSSSGSTASGAGSSGSSGGGSSTGAAAGKAP